MDVIQAKSLYVMKDGAVAKLQNVAQKRKKKRFKGIYITQSETM